MKRWLVGMAALGLAWGHDSSGPGAASVTGIAGDNQSAPRGTPLPAPLSFTALGSDGLPAEGISVTWSSSPAGGAVFTPAATTTDSNGVASTNVVLGNSIGTITMQAALAGVSPVTYHATSIDPCATFTPYVIGDTVSGALSTTDCLIGSGTAAWFYDFYLVNFPSFAQQSFRVSMHGSGTFEDTYVDLYTFAAGEIVQILAFDDDSIIGQDGARNSQLDIIVPGDTTFVIGANSFDPFTTGDYTLTSQNRPATLNGCRAVWVTRGISVTDSITASDCADSSATPKYYHVARIVALSPTVLTLSMKSTTLNPSLSLYQLNTQSYARTLVASNDDSSGTNTNAFVRYTVPVSHFYDIVIGTSGGGEIGEFTFEVSASTTLSPGVPGSAASSRWKSWWRDVGLPKRSRS